MTKKSLKNLIMLVLSVSLVIGAVLAGGCVGEEVLPQIIENITPQEALSLIQENQNNPDLVIIDVRTPDKFAQEHIENAINIEYYSENFRGELDKLDRNKTYLIYYQTGTQSRNALDLMSELNFTEVYKIAGGLVQWKQLGLPTIEIQIIESISPSEAFALIQDNPDFVIIDVRTPDKFAQEHIENAINIDYHSENFRDELDKLDKDNTYLVYYTCACGGIDRKTLNIMSELNFTEVYDISGGLDEWTEEELPTIQEIPPQIIKDITPQEAFTLIQENQDNPDFIIIDVQTPGKFAQKHIENAINLDFLSETFEDELDKLDKDNTYLIYYTCAGGIDRDTLYIMSELNFTEVYNISGGLDRWKDKGLPTIQETPAQIIESITPQEAFDLIQENQDNPDLVIIDIRTPGEFAQWHIEDAINIDYHSSTFQYELGQLDRDKTYLIYYSCACGGIDKKALDMMAELGFKEVYKISGGLTQQKWEGL